MISTPLLLLLLAAPPAAIREPLTLAQAMSRARGGSAEVAAARLRQDAAASRARQAEGFRLPKLEVSETFIRTNSPAESFALLLNQERFSFPTFVASDPNAPSPLNSAITRAELSVPLFTGGELSGRIAQARSAAEAAERTAARTGDTAALAAAEAFVRLAQAEEYARLLARARETVAAHVELARRYVEQGMLVRSELLRAEVELARTEDLLAEAQGNARVAAAALSFHMGVEGSWQPAPLPAPVPLADDDAPWLASAESRPDLAAARKMLEAGEREVKVRRSAFLPKAGATARGDLVDDRLFGRNGRSYTLMAFASLNLFGGGSDKAALAAARAEAEAGRKDVFRFSDGIRLEVKKAFVDARTATARHETAVRATEAARENERILNERFQSGVVKMLDLLDAETALREAETRELTARADAHASLLRLAVAAGRAPESVLAEGASR